MKTATGLLEPETGRSLQMAEELEVATDQELLEALDTGAVDSDHHKDQDTTAVAWELLALALV